MISVSNKANITCNNFVKTWKTKLKNEKSFKYYMPTNTKASRIRESINSMESTIKDSHIYSHTHTHTTKHLTLNTVSSSRFSLIHSSKKAQSALEYMMTYGWAILIIVIVAVILYSMGIFNPSSSVTFTSSGFSPFIIKSAFCNNIGLKVAIQAGPLPNLATSVQVTKVYITSTSGGTISKSEYNLSSPITLTSGSTATTIIPAAVCNTVNTKYSFSAALTYSYSTAAGNVVTNTTGTVAGTSIAGKPSALTNYIPVTITNTQSTSTPQPFQQMVNASSSVYSTYAASNLQNVEFFYYNGTVIPSWLENYTSTHALWWIKVGSIPASSSMTVYMGFASTSTNLFNTVNDGEAPQLSSTYGEYDNGANVFDFYDNFAGTALSSQWTSSSTSSYSIKVDDGLTISLPSGAAAGGAYVNSVNAVVGNNIILQGLINQGDESTTNERGLIGASISNSVYQVWDNGGSSGDTIVGWSAGKDNVGNIIQAMSVLNGAYTYLNSISSNSNLNIYSVFVSDSTVGTYVNDGSVSTTTTDVPPKPLYISLSDYSTGGGAAVNSFYQWIRTRAYPPNGVMPSVTIGSVQ
jgi:hypothetical protein